MYTLHFAPDNASLAVRLALEELGLPYRAALVDRARREQEGHVYRAINPTGLIPALETPDGAIFETGAILLWLADRHGGLAPGPADPARGDFLKWLFFTSNTLHADMRGLFYPQRYAGAADEKGYRAMTEDRILRALSLLDAALSETPEWCRPGEPGAIGCYLAPLVRWLALYPRSNPMRPDPAGLPAIFALLADLETRASARRAAEAEGLGPSPFTAPGYPTPPAGSAT
jgi:glutathione S-transferase